MKKLDKLIINAFVGPFIITFFVVVFILLIQFLIKYLEDIMGKGLGAAIYAQLIFYFSLTMVPMALPLSTLLSSLITFGNLGEHHELTAIKGAGVSLVRALRPIFIITIFIAFTAFYFNNIIAPKASLKAFSLLYDVRTKKASINFKEGVFYDGIPGYKIKITQKEPNGSSVKGIMIYNHTGGRGNTDLVVADSGIIKTTPDERYLIFSLFQGKSFSEYYEGGTRNQFVRNQFDKSRMIFSLASFELNRTKEELFAGNKLMKNINELKFVSDSIRKEHHVVQSNLYVNLIPFFSYIRGQVDPKQQATNYNAYAQTDQVYNLEEKTIILSRAISQARNIKAYVSSHVDRVKYMTEDANSYEIERNKKFTQAIACLIMFLIGAPLGAIIKKGGLGIPVLISIVFFIIFYVLSIMGEKWAKEELVPLEYGVWAANLILLPIGVLFLRQARNDSRLFDTDSYITFFKNLFRKPNVSSNNK